MSLFGIYSYKANRHERFAHAGQLPELPCRHPNKCGQLSRTTAAPRTTNLRLFRQRSSQHTNIHILHNSYTPQTFIRINLKNSVFRYIRRVEFFLVRSPIIQSSSNCLCQHNAWKTDRLKNLVASRSENYARTWADWRILRGKCLPNMLIQFQENACYQSKWLNVWIFTMAKKKYLFVINWIVFVYHETYIGRTQHIHSTSPTPHDMHIVL